MDRYESANKAGILGILGNLFLALIKGFAGFTFNSQAMIADSFNSAGDILSSLFNLVITTIILVMENLNTYFPF